MLQQLRINNVAVIDHVELELRSGLNVITGETGAGKTIVLASLGLLLGARGGSDLIREGADEATVEGLFSDLPPATLDGAEPRMDAVPEVGEHSDAILAELGYAPETVAAWRRARIV